MLAIPVFAIILLFLPWERGLGWKIMRFRWAGRGNHDLESGSCTVDSWGSYLMRVGSLPHCALALMSISAFSFDKGNARNEQDDNVPGEKGER